MSSIIRRRSGLMGCVVIESSCLKRGVNPMIFRQNVPDSALRGDDERRHRGSYREAV
jgi:hypothetical protein